MRALLQCSLELAGKPLDGQQRVSAADGVAIFNPLYFASSAMPEQYTKRRQRNHFLVDAGQRRHRGD